MTAGRVPTPTVPLLTFPPWAQPGAEKFACGSQLLLPIAEAEQPLAHIISQREILFGSFFF